MNKNSNIAKNQSRLTAMRLAELNATDKEDLINCASDMTKTASLDKSEAMVVAQAIRAKYLPNIAKQAGLVVSGLDLEDGKETVDFANDSSDDDEDDLELFKKANFIDGTQTLQNYKLWDSYKREKTN